MLLRSLAATAFLALLLPAALPAQAGGPDAFGYTWIDADSSALPFRWIDIVGKPGATRLTSLSDDNQSPFIPIGFPFRYYWTTHTHLSIGSNGWLSLGTGTTGNAHCFQYMPSTNAQSSNNTLAPFLCDLTFTSNYATLPNIGECWYYTSPTLDSFIVTYKDVPFWKDDNFATNPPDWIGANTFQAILTTADSAILFQYLHIDRDSQPTYAACPNDLIIGIENSTGQIGLNVRQEDPPRDSFAIRFSYPKLDTFQVRDAAMAWNLGPGSKARFILPGQPLNMRAQVRNVGNTSLDSTLHIDAKVLSIGFNIRWQGTDSLPGLPENQDTVLHFPQPCVLTLPGQYYYNTALSTSEDFNANNDLLSSEIQVVDTISPTPSLQYNLGTTTASSTSWPPGLAGDYGAGIFMQPPWQIYRVVAIRVFVVGNDGNPSTPLPAGFRVDLHAADTSGALSQLLSSTLVTPANAVEDGWNTIFLTNPPVLMGRGFYVGWIQGGPGVGLGNETAGPKSRQTYEIIGGQWAPYRAQNSEDFLINVLIEPLLVSTPAPATPAFELSLHPNPSAGHTTATWHHPGGPASLRLCDQLGRVHRHTEIAPRSPGTQHTDFSLGNLSNGVYFLHLSTQGGNAHRAILLER